MNSRLCAYFGNPWVGMLIKTNDEKTFVPLDVHEKIVRKISENLKTDIIQLSMGNSNLLGIYLAMNSSGAILPNIATEGEIAVVKQAGLNVYVPKDKNNAYGNNILVNDKGALINEHIDKREIKNISDALGVEVLEGKIADYTTVGSTCIANNYGFLAHFGANETEMGHIKAQLKVNGAKGSINTGAGFIACGVVQNKHGYIAGEQSTAFELGRIEEALGYLE